MRGTCGQFPSPRQPSKDLQSSDYDRETEAYGTTWTAVTISPTMVSRAIQCSMLCESQPSNTRKAVGPIMHRSAGII